MSRFNATVTPARPDTINLAGGKAFSQDVRNELASLLLTSFIQDKFYRSGDDELQRIRQLVAQDPLFAAKAAVYARNEFGMRSVSHVVAGEVVQHVKGEEWTKFFLRDVVRRPDDMTEIVAYRAGTYGLHPFPNSLKKGLRLAFEKFDSYQLAKYRGDSKDISLIDVVNLVKPRPVERNADALNQLVNGTLKSFDTWESRLSAGEDKNTVWRELLSTNKLGYMALLRNLRNIAQQADDATFSLALQQLQDPERVHKSLVLPFRYYTAYKQLSMDLAGNDRQPLLLGALSVAADHAISNIPDMDGRTLIALDMSGSMKQRQVSGRSEAKCIEIASLFAAALSRRLAGRSRLLMFDTEVRMLPVNPADSVLTVTENIIRNAGGGGTMMDLIFEHNEVFDRVIILSDMQSWVGDVFMTPEDHYWGNRGRQLPSEPANDALNRYRKRTGADPMVFALDLHGYGTMQFPAGKCAQIAGWSEKVFDLFPHLERDKGAMVRVIDKVGFGL